MSRSVEDLILARMLETGDRKWEKIQMEEGPIETEKPVPPNRRKWDFYQVITQLDQSGINLLEEYRIQDRIKTHLGQLNTVLEQIESLCEAEGGKNTWIYRKAGELKKNW